MSASLEANEESCDIKEDDELDPRYMLLRLPTEEAELARVWPMGRRVELALDDIILGLADTVFGRMRVCVYACEYSSTHRQFMHQCVVL